ncbi:diacylglycerol/lipid kinase family protein [Planctomonas psychrotolerans]|uniref:diacylglycerol/lipid kinase family protein n=1 Tax=Planctomonas psychrotolerans TaxID=2528712 RepID=UPI001239E3DA|nr:diacylglycerol kinase family protein [Planctomonas psychrotolerans]
MQPAPPVIVVAVNPEAAFGRHRGVGDEVAAALTAAGWRVTLVRESSAERLRVAVAAELGVGDAGRAIGIVSIGTDGGVAPGNHPHALVVVGGDGMVSLAANLVARTGIPFGIVPTGTGNDMARSLGVPVGDPPAAIRHLVGALRRPSRAIDAGLVHSSAGSTWFACVLSAGFDAVVNERANRMRRPRGASRYVLALLREITTFCPLRYSLTLDGVRTDTRAMLVSVGNGASIGGGMRVTPDAMVDDELLDVLVVAPLGRLAFLRVFPRVFAGTHTALPQVTVTRAISVRISGPDVVAYADGERIGPLPLDIRVVPSALRVFA